MYIIWMEKSKNRVYMNGIGTDPRFEERKKKRGNGWSNIVCICCQNVNLPELFRQIFPLAYPADGFPKKRL